MGCTLPDASNELFYRARLIASRLEIAREAEGSGTAHGSWLFGARAFPDIPAGFPAQIVPVELLSPRRVQIHVPLVIPMYPLPLVRRTNCTTRGLRLRKSTRKASSSPSLTRSMRSTSASFKAHLSLADTSGPPPRTGAILRRHRRKA